MIHDYGRDILGPIGMTKIPHDHWNTSRTHYQKDPMAHRIWGDMTKVDAYSRWAQSHQWNKFGVISSQGVAL